MSARTIGNQSNHVVFATFDDQLRRGYRTTKSLQTQQFEGDGKCQRCHGDRDREGDRERWAERADADRRGKKGYKNDEHTTTQRFVEKTPTGTQTGTRRAGEERKLERLIVTLCRRTRHFHTVGFAWTDTLHL